MGDIANSGICLSFGYFFRHNIANAILNLVINLCFSIYFNGHDITNILSLLIN